MLVFFGVVSFFLAVGAALDRVVSDDGKQQFFSVTPLLTADGSGRMGGVTDQIFRLFFAKHLSLKSLLAVSLISVSVFCGVLAIRWATTGENIFGTAFTGIQGAGTKALFVAVIATAVVATDLCSFIKTRILLGLLRHCKNALEVGVVLLCELLCSMVVFSSVFAIGLVGAVWVANSERQWTGDLYVHFSVAETELPRVGDDLPAPLNELLSRPGYRYDIGIRTPGSSDFISADAQIHASDPVGVSDLSALFAAMSSPRMSMRDVRPASGSLPYDDVVLAEHPYDYVAQGRFDILHPLDPLTLDQYYTTAFSFADSAQDGFPVSILGEPGWARLWHMDIAIQSGLRSTPALGTYPAFCRDNEIVHIASAEKMTACKRWLIVTKDIADSFLYIVHFFGQTDLGYVPIYSAFLSSLTLTVAFYLLFACSLLVGASERGFEGRASTLTWLKTKDHPFTLALGIVGVFVAFGSLLLSLVSS